MDKRLVKQLIIALIVVVFIAFLLFISYFLFFKPVPSCFDGIKNQEEEGIDCGGPCLSCEFLDIKEIEVLWTKVLLSQDNFYDLVAQIKNPNQNYGSGYIPCKFELYDSKNNLISQYSVSTFILPNQTKYFLKTRVQSSVPINKVKLLFNEIEWQKLEDEALSQLVIQQKEYRLLGSEEIGFSRARGVLINKTDFDFDKIDIDALLFDSSRNLLAVGVTEMRTLLAGQERDFIITWFNEFYGQVAFVEMEPETNMFDPDNFLPAGQGDRERFQEY